MIKKKYTRKKRQLKKAFVPKYKIDKSLIPEQKKQTLSLTDHEKKIISKTLGILVSDITIYKLIDTIDVLNDKLHPINMDFLMAEKDIKNATTIDETKELMKKWNVIKIVLESKTNGLKRLWEDSIGKNFDIYYFNQIIDDLYKITEQDPTTLKELFAILLAINKNISITGYLFSQIPKLKLFFNTGSWDDIAHYIIDRSREISEMKKKGKKGGQIKYINISDQYETRIAPYIDNTTRIGEGMAPYSEDFFTDELFTEFFQKLNPQIIEAYEDGIIPEKEFLLYKNKPSKEKYIMGKMMQIKYHLPSTGSALPHTIKKGGQFKYIKV